MKICYHAFLDESGQREYGVKTDKYFVVAGAIVRIKQRDVYETELNGLKRAYFGTTDVEIKSNWLRQPHERKKRYIDPYGIDKDQLTRFVDAIYQWINATGLVFIASVVDKVQMAEQYRNPHNPSAVGYNIFLQRFQNFLAPKHSLGKVTFDTMTGATEAGNQWKTLLRRQHTKLQRQGCPYTGMTFDNVASKIHFADSAQYSLLQMADLAAYNTFRQFRTYGKAWDKPEATELPVYEYFDRLLPRFRQNSHGVFAGFGVATMPITTRHEWLV